MVQPEFAIAQPQPKDDAGFGEAERRDLEKGVAIVLSTPCCLLGEGVLPFILGKAEGPYKDHSELDIQGV